MSLLLVLGLQCALLLPAAAQTPDPLDSYDALRERLMAFSLASNAELRDADLDALWDRLQETGRLPYVEGERVAFLLRDPGAHSVAVAGDFNGWNKERDQAQRLVGTDLWLFEATFPLAARLDYKFVVDGGRWILDPANPRNQRGGFGDNSELRMPGYQPSPWVERRPDTPRGTLTAGTIDSAALGYPVNYRVYAPAGYDELADLPVLYVTDGHEYADDKMGSLVIVLDNLIAAGRLRPLLAVFIDPRFQGRNLRGEQYILSEDFVRFATDELVPVIDANWRSSPRREDRGILGTSLGGLNSAWFALRAPRTFGRIGIQSPAFQAGEGRILDLYRAAPRLDGDLFLTWGTMHDFGEHTLEFQRLLDEKGYSYRYLTVPEGHSWGQWRALLDDILLAFWPAR